MIVFKRDLMLDTNTLTHLLKPKHSRHKAAVESFTKLLELATQCDGDTSTVFVVSSLVLFEARRGLFASKAVRQLRELERFLRSYADIVDFGETEADAAAQLWATPPRHNNDLDLMILATAIANEADILSEDSDIHNLSRPEDMKVWTWDTLTNRLTEASSQLDAHEE